MKLGNCALLIPVKLDASLLGLAPCHPSRVHQAIPYQLMKSLLRLVLHGKDFCIHSQPTLPLNCSLKNCPYMTNFLVSEKERFSKNAKLPSKSLMESWRPIPSRANLYRVDRTKSYRLHIFLHWWNRCNKFSTTSSWNTCSLGFLLEEFTTPCVDGHRVMKHQPHEYTLFLWSFCHPCLLPVRGKVRMEKAVSLLWDRL